ncbi:MAG: prolipoprotein diacylglyceryl transferase [Candidatus Omnitrophica bacterium]|nr:prolipoprotein diacylglyceryl transferase [Candidatus Omnitrophota bacterium]
MTQYMHPILFSIGPVTIYTYGFLTALGILVGLCFALDEAKRLAIPRDTIINLFLIMVIAGFIGARFFYILTELKIFLSNPISMIFARQGFVFYGGFITALLAMYVYAKKIKADTWKIADVFAPTAAIGHAIGRVGCFFYGCCYGYIPFGKFTIPVQLAEAAALLSIFFILVFVLRLRKIYDGTVFWLYVFLYAVARFALEFFRHDPRGHIWIFSTSQFMAVFAAVIAVIMLILLQAKRKNKGKIV